MAGYASLRVPLLPSGKAYILRISATPQELARVSAIKVLVTQESSTIYPQVRLYLSLLPRSSNDFLIKLHYTWRFTSSPTFYLTLGTVEKHAARISLLEKLRRGDDRRRACRCREILHSR